MNSHRRQKVGDPPASERNHHPKDCQKRPRILEIPEENKSLQDAEPGTLTEGDIGVIHMQAGTNSRLGFLLKSEVYVYDVLQKCPSTIQVPSTSC
jgi:hypothetical protein